MPVRGKILPLALALIALGARSSRAAGASRAESREKIILDTDSAYFMDDGAALAMILSDDRLQILGITTVIGNFHVKDGAQYLFTVLKAAGRPDVPLYMGADRPLKNSPERVAEFQKNWGGVDWVGAYSARKPKPPFGGLAGLSASSRPAEDFIIDAVRANPGEITILAIGPLTNIAQALAKAPDIAAKIKRIVIMGGNAVFTGSFDDHRSAPRGSIIGNSSALAEFNFWFDPEAAKLVLRSEIPEKELFGLDITNRARIGRSQFEEVVKAKTPVAALLEWDLGWDRGAALDDPHGAKKERKVWDIVPAAYLIDPGVVTDSEEMYVDVIDQFGPAYGQLYAHRPGFGSPAPGVKKVTVMKDLNLDRFYSVFVAGLTAPARARTGGRGPLPH